MSDCCATDGLMRLEEALDRLTQSVQPISETEKVSLEACLGRVLSETIVSPINVPSHDNSAMDGYALRLKDLDNNDTLPLAGQSFAGHPFQGKLPSGHCIRIMTGASVPKDTDTVIMQEQTEAIAETINSKSSIRFLKKPEKEGNNVRRAGEDIAEGQQVLVKGRRLKPQDIGLLASLGIALVPVFRQLTVAVFSTGDELRLPGEQLGEGDIYDSNRFVVKAMLNKMDIQIIDLGRIPDDKDKLRSAFQQADKQADAVITSGGVSVGEADYTKGILDELGETGFWKLAIKPGKPFAFGKLPNSYFFGLPGNPVSATVTFQQLAAPALRHMMNQSPESRVELSLKNDSALKKKPGRRDFQRGVLTQNPDGELEVCSTGSQGSGILSSMSQSDCYIVLPEEQGNVAAGEQVRVQLFDELLS